MNTYGSLGLGKNSVAMMLLCLDLGIKVEWVFCDLGCEWPETYDYLALLREKGYPITVVKPQVDGWCDNLSDYIMRWGIAPFVRSRWCTDKFKVRPLNAYFVRPAKVLIGFARCEEHRQGRRKPTPGIEHTYPLIDGGFYREDCSWFIEQHGLPDPPKSSCFFCVFQQAREYRRLRDQHPCLFARAVQQEERRIAAAKERGKRPYFWLGGPVEGFWKPLTKDKVDKAGKVIKRSGQKEWVTPGRSLLEIVQDDQGDLWTPPAPRPCECGL